ncbi:MAG: DNA-3-methyladenine glycosylase [Thermoleophilaceae bacterium]|nr:DNA-3-methyladenine glycosylase [Thermoleophilaceae bacterium]
MSKRPSAATGAVGGGAAAVVDGEAVEHLRGADPTLRELIDRLGPLDPEARRRGRPTDAYGALLRSIVGQQLSTKAARSIYERVTALFDGRTPTPEQLLAADPEVVRGAGLSRPKVRYMRDLAEHVLSGQLELDRLDELSDERITAELTAVKGLGQWTADMFLIFHLGRPDVLPVGDLGVRRAVEHAYGLPEIPSPEEVERLGERWRPHRSLASLYLWRSLDNQPA